MRGHPIESADRVRVQTERYDLPHAPLASTARTAACDLNSFRRSAGRPVFGLRLPWLRAGSVLLPEAIEARLQLGRADFFRAQPLLGRGQLVEHKAQSG